jgi:hypothetical protein
MDLNRARVAAACDQALAICHVALQFNPQFDVMACINQEKNDIKHRFAHVPDIEGLVENHDWNPPRQRGGKRKSTRKSTRRKNTRKNRRSSRKF